ncbi:MAG: hypothetical protein K0V04_25345 [Deltaproteobacteria bacterium]|nr:hypothetical protein [Deltaproteobacteria bacterium]
MGLVHGCYQGGERDKDPPPGLPGGLCLAPDGHCESGLCNRDRNFCYDPADPCNGFFCGGDDRGRCIPNAQTLEPSCECAIGFNNNAFALYCCPDAGLGVVDPNCAAPTSDDGAVSDGPAGTTAMPMTSDGSTGGAMTDGTATG